MSGDILTLIQENMATFSKGQKRIAAFILVAFFQLVTLPVEFNASRRALAALSADSSLSESDLRGSKKVLRAAAMTYVAALVTSFMQILYYLSRLNRRRD